MRHRSLDKPSFSGPTSNGYLSEQVVIPIINIGLETMNEALPYGGKPRQRSIITFYKQAKL